MYLTLMFYSSDKMFLNSLNIYTICSLAKLLYHCLRSYIVKKQVGLIVTNFIQLVSPQPVDQISQTKLHWKA